MKSPVPPPACVTYRAYEDQDRALVIVQDARHRFVSVRTPVLAMVVGEHLMLDSVVGYVVQLDNPNGGVSEITVGPSCLRLARLPITFPRPVLT